ncbi:MAG: hypothetical protein CMH62_02200 [Nanoarchaeota archaeon]|nr:hypothetical protein [Nanoarchaeota archaeon]|tara:strand:+ start:1308 stop:1649 length:342 start_codon:yes stop_codon:yes gene_type:complete
MADQNTFNEVIGRLRINESKLTTLRERLLVTDSNMISEYKNIAKEIKNLNVDIRELKNNLETIKETMKDIIKGTENFASSQDVAVLEKYINMWNPLNFVTEKEVRKIVKEKNG